MIHFLDPQADGELLAELKDEGVLTPDVIARTEASMGRPESGTLNAFLLAGADFIPERTWLAWLIRRHGCHRFGRVLWDDGAAAWAARGLPADGNLPYRTCPDGAVLVAILRPDLSAATGTRLKPARMHPAAATLAEIRALAFAWAERQPGA